MCLKLIFKNSDPAIIGKIERIFGHCSSFCVLSLFKCGSVQEGRVLAHVGSLFLQYTFSQVIYVVYIAKELVCRYKTPMTLICLK